MKRWRSTAMTVFCLPFSCGLTLLVTGAASAADDAPFRLDPGRTDAGQALPANMLLAQAPAEQPVPSKPTTVVEAEPALPISFGLTYGLYSDYWWRGINWSEYKGEGREKLNHQLTVELAVDLKEFGKIGFSTWFEWYAAQKQLDPDHGGQNCQEIDYTIWYGYSFDQIKTDVSVGIVFYEYLNLARILRADDIKGNDNDDRSVELYLSLEHNDAWMWKWLFPDNEEGILNPSFLFAQDVGSITGSWMEWGFSHDFKIPGIENLTITPGYKLTAQCNYWQQGCFFAGDIWSLTTTYDLTPVLQLPSWAGTVTVGGELYFFNAYDQFQDSGTSKDHFWGGMTVNWSWGG